MISLINLDKIKVIITERSSISELKYSNNLINKLKNELIYFLARILYKFSDLIITNSKFEKKYIQDKFQLQNVIHGAMYINVMSITQLEFRDNL